MLLRTNADELDVVFWVQGFDGTLGFGCELSDQGTVFNSIILTHSGADGDASGVYDDNTL
jgi:hypothetical protein